MNRKLVAGLLSAGALVQVLGLTVEVQRLYLERPFAPAYMFEAPLLYFHPSASHFLQRPREIWEILRLDERRIESFTPAARPLFPVTDNPRFYHSDMLVYRVLNSFRPWWISQRYLPVGQRVADLDRTVLLFALLAAAGLAMTSLHANRRSAVSPSTATRRSSSPESV